MDRIEILRKLSDATNCTDSYYYDSVVLNSFARYYEGKIYRGASDNYIVEKFIEYCEEVVKIPCRRCSVCGSLMQEGFCYNMGEKYYCSLDCLHTDFSDIEWDWECHYNDQSYYTEWH